MRIDGALPSSLEVLMEDDCIQAADAVDGIAHGNFLPSNSARWNVDGKVKDLWNNAYQYTPADADTRTGEIVSSAGHGTELHARRCNSLDVLMEKLLRAEKVRLYFFSGKW